MLRRTCPFLVALVLLVGLPFAILSFSSDYQYCISHQGEHQTIQSHDNGAPVINIPLSHPTGFSLTVYCIGVFASDDAPGITAIATLLLTLVTAGLVWVTYLQLAANRIQSRPHVFATQLNSFWDLDPQTSRYNWRLAPTWTNSGDTPTRRLRTWSYCEVRNSVLPNGFQPEANTTAATIATGLIPPKCANVGGSHPISGPLTPQDIWDAQQGHRFIFLYGWVRYFDGFPGSREHVTCYCWQITSFGDPFTFQPSDAEHSLTFNYLVHREGNCADDEC
jgi:hypothetical protein